MKTEGMASILGVRPANTAGLSPPGWIPPGSAGWRPPGWIPPGSAGWRPAGPLWTSSYLNLKKKTKMTIWQLY